jgi:hypothetical protein
MITTELRPGFRTAEFPTAEFPTAEFPTCGFPAGQNSRAGGFPAAEIPFR